MFAGLENLGQTRIATLPPVSQKTQNYVIGAVALAVTGAVALLVYKQIVRKK